MINSNILKFHVNPQHLHGDSRLKNIKLEDYTLQQSTQDNPFSYSDKIQFQSENGIFLLHKKIDSAVIGYNLDNNVANTIQIQGGRGKFKELTPIKWEKVLLENLIIFSKFKNYDSITIPTFYNVQGDSSLMNPEKLQLRYDINARSNNFRFSKEEKLYILDL